MEIRNRVKEGIGIVKKRGHGKYLGLPELFGRKKRDLFTSLVDRIKQKALNWSTKRLSNVGKVIMLKTVLSAIPNYTMSCFQILLSLCKRIQSALTRYWWDSSNEKKGMYWVAWKTLAKSKRDGSLGFREVKAFNMALLGKISWRIITRPKCLLAKLLTGKYCKKKGFLEVEAANNASHGWRGILEGRDLIKRKLGRAIGDGGNTDIWGVPWLSTREPLAFIGHVPQDVAGWKVERLIKQNSNEWNVEMIRRLMSDLEKEIRAIQPSHKGIQDKWIWTEEQNGEYSAKSGYHEALSMDDGAEIRNHQQQDFNWEKYIWKKKLDPRIELFLWKTMREALPIGENLKRSKITETDECCKCGEKETVKHAMLHCEDAKETWRNAPFYKQVRPESWLTFKDALENAEKMISLPPVGVSGGLLFANLCWEIWNNRNKQVFEKRRTAWKETITEIIAEAREWTKANLAEEGKNREDQRGGEEHKETDIQPTTLAFSDAAWRTEDNEAGLGWYMKDLNGNELTRKSQSRSHVSSPLMAEALAIFEALKEARKMHMNKLRMSSDSLTLIRTINTKNYPKELYGILHDINDLALTFISISFVYVSRKLNYVADSLAKGAMRTFVPISCNGLVP